MRTTSALHSEPPPAECRRAIKPVDDVNKKNDEAGNFIKTQSE